MILLPAAAALIGEIFSHEGVREAGRHVTEHVGAHAAKSAAEYLSAPRPAAGVAPSDCAARWRIYAYQRKVQAGPTGRPAGDPPNCPPPINVR